MNNKNGLIHYGLAAARKFANARSWSYLLLAFLLISQGTYEALAHYSSGEESEGKRFTYLLILLVLAQHTLDQKMAFESMSKRGGEEEVG